jgi:hypothetical protein
MVIHDKMPRVVRLRELLPFVIAALPPLYLISILLTSTIDVPFADQWALIPLLERSYRGTLSIRDLWAQHNEHRLLFPRLIMLALARLSGWNTHAEMLANVILAAGIFGLLVYQLRATARFTQMAWVRIVPMLALAVFSLNQAENWWGGWNIQIFLNVLTVSASLILLAAPTRRLGALALALGCGIVATYSYSTGLLIWPLGLLLLIMRSDRWTQRNAAWIIAWICGGGLTIASFFYHYTWTAQTPTLAELLSNPGRYLTYTFTYLGAAPTRGAVEYLFGLLTGDRRAFCNLGDSDLCGYVNSSAIAAGAIGIALFLLIVRSLLRRLPLQALLAYLGLGLYALGTGAFTSLGRANYGNHQALAQRYATNASLFWLALVILLALHAHMSPANVLKRTSVIALFGLFSTSIALCTLQGPDHFRWQYDYLEPARNELYTLADDDLLRRLYFDPQVVRQGAAILKQHHLSVFR